MARVVRPSGAAGVYIRWPDQPDHEGVSLHSAPHPVETVNQKSP
jgi:hypothetical protein